MNISSKLKRVKAQADHLFLRGERTDVVGDLRTAEDQADNLKVLCEALRAAIEKTLHTHNTPEEKRIRKVNESHGAEALKDALHQLSLNTSNDQQPDQPAPHNTLLRDIVEQAAESQQGLSLEVLHYDKRIEEEVLRPLTIILQRDFSNWAKLRKQLKQVGQELDAARSRYRSSSSSSASVAASATNAARADTHKEEMEDAESRLDQVKDNYACELFLLLSKERELCELVERFLQIRQDRFIKSQSLLSTVLPKLERQLACSSTGPVYGIRLDQHLKLSQKKVAVPIEVCLRRLADVGIQEEGLFRMAGSATKVKRLRGAFDANLIDASTFVSAGDEYHRDYDVHVLAGAFKLYLRELPEPLLTYTLHAEWLEAARTPDRDEKLKKLWSAVKKLPGPNFDNLSFVIQFLALLASHQSHNKMTPNNIAIVIAPNLIWSPEDNKLDDVMGTLGRNMSLGTLYRQIVEQLVECSEYFFGESVVDFGTPKGVPGSPDVAGNTVLNGSIGHGSANTNIVGQQQLQQQQQQHPTPSFATLPRGHNRNRSADFITLDSKFQQDPSCESPKHPQRRKKQAPLPPQGTAGTRGVHDTSQTNSSSSSPEQIRSHPPPRSEIPAPIPPFSRTYPALPTAPVPSTKPVAATRLHHSGSIRRPNIEPPKPPVSSAASQQPRTEKPPQQPIPAVVSGHVSGIVASSHVTGDGTNASSCRSPPPRPQPPNTTAAARSSMMAVSSEMSASVESSSMSSSSLSSDGPGSASVTESGSSATTSQQRSHVDVATSSVKPFEESSPSSVGHQSSNVPAFSAAKTGPGTPSSTTTPTSISQSTPKQPIGFEHLDDSGSNASTTDIEMQGNAVVFRNKNLDDSSEVFLRDGLEGEESTPSNLTASSKVFRKSLENVIQQQASGQPLILPKHLVTDSTSSNNNSTDEIVDFREVSIEDPNANTSKDNGMAVDTKEEVAKAGFPVPAVRISKETPAADRPEPAARSDKPALPEKPTTLPRPAPPERPPLAPRPSSNPPCKPLQAAPPPAVPLDTTGAGEDGDNGGEVEAERRQEGEVDGDDITGRDDSASSPAPEYQSTFAQSKKKNNLNNNSSNNSTTGISSNNTNIKTRGGGATKTVISRKVTPHSISGSVVDTVLHELCGTEHLRTDTMSSSLGYDMIGGGEEDTDRRQRSRSGGSITANVQSKCDPPGDVVGEGGSKVSQRIQALAGKTEPSKSITNSPPYLRSKSTAATTTHAPEHAKVGVRKSIHVLQDQLFGDSTLQRARDGQCVIQKKKVPDDTSSATEYALLSRSLENLDQVSSSSPCNDTTTAQTGPGSGSTSRYSLHFSPGNKRITRCNGEEGSHSGRRKRPGLRSRNASMEQLLDESPSRTSSGLAPPPPQFRDSGSDDGSAIGGTADDDQEAVWQKRKGRSSQELRDCSGTGDQLAAAGGGGAAAATTTTTAGGGATGKGGAGSRAAGDVPSSNSNNSSPNTKRANKKKNFPPPQPPSSVQLELTSQSPFIPSRTAPKPPLAPKGSVGGRTISPNSRSVGEVVANSTDF